MKFSLKADNLLNVPRETEHASCTFMLTADHRSVCKCGNIRRGSDKRSEYASHDSMKASFVQSNQLTRP